MITCVTGGVEIDWKKVSTCKQVSDSQNKQGKKTHNSEAETNVEDGEPTREVWMICAELMHRFFH